MTFRQFLMTKKREDSPKGDLARDVFRDITLKGKRLTVETVEQRVRRFGDRKVLLTLNSLSAEFKKLQS